MGYSSQLAIAVQVNAERHNKWLAGGMIRRVKIQWTNNTLDLKITKGNKQLKRKDQLVGEAVIQCRKLPFLFVRICRWSAKFVFNFIPHRANIFLGLAHLGRDHLP